MLALALWRMAIAPPFPFSAAIGSDRGSPVIFSSYDLRCLGLFMPLYYSIFERHLARARITDVTPVSYDINTLYRALFFP